MYKLGLEKAEEPEIKFHTSVRSSKKQENSRNVYFCFIDYVKAFDCRSQQTGKFSKRWEYQTTLPVSEKPVCRSKSNKIGHGTSDWFIIGIEYDKAIQYDNSSS